MLLSELGKLGAVEILTSAAQEIADRGFCCDLPYEPYNGSINIVGALALACGSKDKDLLCWDGELEFAPVPSVRYPIFMELITYMCSIAMCDIDEWCWSADKTDAKRILQNAADRIIISAN